MNFYSVIIILLSLVIDIDGLFDVFNRQPKGSLFSSIPFLPKPLFKPERYMKSARAKRSYYPRRFFPNPLPQGPAPRINNYYRPVNQFNQYNRRPLAPVPMMTTSTTRMTRMIPTTTQKPFDFNGINFNNVYIPMPDPSKKPYDGPTVVPILYGNYSLGESKHLFTSSVALVIDEKAETNERCYILVDTGLSIFKNSIIGGLAAHGVKMSDIQTLVLTHLDVDSLGNLNLFPHVNILTENKLVNRQYVYIQKTAPSFDSKRSGLPYRPLCDNTDVFLTPGLSPKDLSLVVKNVSGYGTIAIVGSLIFDEQDLKDKNKNVKEFSLDEDQMKLWEATRQEIVCLADFILPGHGSTFRVTPQLKSLYNCQKRS